MPEAPQTGADRSVMDDQELATALLDASPDGLLLVDPDGVIRLANPSSSTIFGRAGDELVGMRVEQLVPEERRAGHVHHRERYVRRPDSRPMGSGLRLFAEHADGTLFPVEISLSPIVSDGVQYTIATVRDVTDREEALSNVALLKDRERIARDLHDMVIQRLFAAGMSLQAVAGQAGSPIVTERIHATIDELDDTIKELRGTIFRLGQQEERSLSSQVTELVHHRSRLLGFRPELEIDGSLSDLPEHVSDQLLATVTEGLSNVARHAEATEAVVRIERTGDGLVLTIADNGVGMSPEPKRLGGLSNMMWRAAELGGTCTIGAEDSTGTRLEWTVPV
ncbi:MAG: PAS domain-containing sensor histidine kinase [Ilumatobacteraceae bacterium]